MQPIEIWWKLINAEPSDKEMRMRLEQIYRENRPSIAEIIMNSHCPNQCLHCIYPSDYHQHNRNMNGEAWKTAFQFICEELDLKRFIFDGRAVTKESVQAIRLLKRDFPGVRVGLIADGISLEPFVEDIIDYPPDWLDVSVDGLEKDHDIQRNSEGSYRKTLEVLTRLKESEALEKINILTCLTRLNLKSVIGMIRLLNATGFLNFFITPVSVVKGHRPDPGLQPGNDGLTRWVRELAEATRSLSDSWVEVDIFDAAYGDAIHTLGAELAGSYSMQYDHLDLETRSRENEFHICYYPYSLAGIRELIINSNGDIIPTNVMAMGKIPDGMIFGNIFDWEKEFFQKLPEKEAFSYYLEEILQERNAFRQDHRIDGMFLM